MARRRESTTEARIWRVERGAAEARADRVATEEPLEIRLRWPAGQRTVAVTMRTPGADEELALGFLFAEGVVEGASRVAGVERLEPNGVEVALGDGPAPELASLERHFFATSACGVCGKAGLEALQVRAAAPPPDPIAAGIPAPAPAEPAVAPLTPEMVCSLPRRLRRAQGLFA